MAILQISRIQSRRGLQEDLPQLASAEIGFALDTRKVYIGNGDITEGAPSPGVTEILTQYSDMVGLSGTYTYAGLAAGFTVSTTVTTPRSLQDKLDDISNFRDFGGKGDGATNNVVNFNNTIIKLYNEATANYTQSPTSQPATAAFRTLHLSAGIYNISGDFIRMLPYVRLKGDGKNSTFIVQTDATQPCVISSCDTAGVTGFPYHDIIANVNIASTSVGSGAGYIEAEDITFVNATSKDVIYLNSVSDVFFSRVRLTGNASVLTSNVCVRVGSVGTGSYLTSSNLTFRDCDFAYNRLAFYCDDNVTNVQITGGTGTNLYRGIVVGELTSAGSASISSVKVSNVEFNAITNEAIYSPRTDVPNIVSAFNVFDDVGSAPSVAVNVSGNSCYSIGDAFGTTYTGTLPGINLQGSASFAALSNGQMLLGTLLTVGGQHVTLGAASSGTAGVVGSGINATILDYAILVSPDQRVGTIKIATDGINPPAFFDDYVETTALGITLTPVLVGSTIELNYINPGATATLKTTTRTLL